MAAENAPAKNRYTEARIAMVKLALSKCWLYEKRTGVGGVQGMLDLEKETIKNLHPVVEVDKRATLAVKFVNNTNVGKFAKNLTGVL